MYLADVPSTHILAPLFNGSQRQWPKSVWNSGGGDTDADPEGLIEGDEWSPPEKRILEGIRPLPRKKIDFLFETACFGEF